MPVWEILRRIRAIRDDWEKGREGIAFLRLLALEEALRKEYEKYERWAEEAARRSGWAVLN